MTGPTLPISQYIHRTKYRSKGESFEEAMYRIAAALADDDEHYHQIVEVIMDMRYLFAGRVQAAVGSPRQVTPYNCFVSDTIEDSMSSILKVLGEAAETMRQGGGIGYDFSSLRPSGDLIESLDSQASGPVSFMDPYDAMCGTISSAGHRRGAQMGVLRVDHPDIETYINAKQNTHKLTNFNTSIAITDDFMEAVMQDRDFPLTFNGHTYRTVKAAPLFEKIMRSTWDWAEPGVLFIDRINKMNNLWYCEKIVATNPCGEQPLPPHGACLLGSFNLVKYITGDPLTLPGATFNWEKFKRDIHIIVRAMDNVIDAAKYPLPQQRQEAINKRRMGIGYTGLANAAESLGCPYGSDGFLQFMAEIGKTMRDTAYRSSVENALRKEPFALFSPEQYGKGLFIQSLPPDLQSDIQKYGIRNSHLTSIAPTGTISLTADNVSSGLEPVFSYEEERTIIDFDGPRTERLTDYAYREWGIKGKRSTDCTAQNHLDVLCEAQRWVDSSVSKTCVVDPHMKWEDFKNIYFAAWGGGAKGCTTFNPEGKRFGVRNSVDDEGAACYVNERGERSCE